MWGFIRHVYVLHVLCVCYNLWSQRRWCEEVVTKNRQVLESFTVKGRKLELSKEVVSQPLFERRYNQGAHGYGGLTVLFHFI